MSQRHSTHTFASAAGQLAFLGFDRSLKPVLSIHGVLDSITGTGNIEIYAGNTANFSDAVLLKDDQGNDFQFDVTAGNFVAEIYTPQTYKNYWVSWPNTVTGGTMALHENDN